MQIALNAFLLLLGFVILIQSAKVFVNSSVEIAKRLKIPSMVIGLTVVAFGTSAPEVVIGISAALSGSGELAISNSVGANLFNQLFIVGFCAMLFPISVKLTAISRDYWVSFGATVFLLVMVIIFNDYKPRISSLFLLVGFFVYMFIVIHGALKNKVDDDTQDSSEVLNPLWKSIAFTILGAALIAGGGQLTVFGASNIAFSLGISERIVGLTIVAIGTSLPELVTTLLACRKGEGEFALGFIIGSGIFNIMFVLGIAGLITPLSIGIGVTLDMIVLTLGTLAFFLFAKSNERIVRFEGFLMAAMYVAYIVWAILA